MKKKLLYIIPILLIVFGAVLFKTSNDSSSPTESVEQEVPENIELIINYGNGNSSSHSLNTSGEETAFSILEKIAKEKKIALNTQQYDFGIFVKAIGEKESSAEMAWIYFVNGESGQVAADQYQLKAGDKVEWKYIAPEM